MIIIQTIKHLFSSREKGTHPVYLPKEVSIRTQEKENDMYAITQKPQTHNTVERC